MDSSDIVLDSKGLINAYYYGPWSTTPELEVMDVTHTPPCMHAQIQA